MHKLAQAILRQNRSHDICVVNGVMIFIDVTREYSSAAEHLDENPKVYPLFIFFPHNICNCGLESKFLRR